MLLPAITIWPIAMLGHQPLKPHVAGGAMEILEERFARGEIDKGEFEDRRQVLAAAK
jgi:uncharacterized membrane protein